MATLEILEILKPLAVISVQIGVLLLSVILFSVLYKILLKPEKIANKKRWDVKAYFFLRKKHLTIGFIALCFILCHVLFMLSYLRYKESNFLPAFGIFAVISILVTVILGLSRYIMVRSRKSSQLKINIITFLHAICAILVFIFVYMHTHIDLG